MTKKIVSIIAAILMVLCFTACSQEEQSDKAYELEGVGVDELVALEIPEGYEETDTTQNGVGTDAEILSQSWANEDSSITLAMLSCNGKGVMGMDGSLEDYIEGDQFEDTVSLNSPGKDAYISYAGGTAEDGATIESNTIEAVFAYDGYVLSLDMANTKEQPITDAQKETFYKVLTNMKLL